MQFKEVFIKTFSDRKYAEDFMWHGKMMFRPAFYFNEIEDNRVRGDISEGVMQQSTQVFHADTIKTIEIVSPNIGKRFLVDWKKACEDLNIPANQEGCLRLTYKAAISIFCITYANDSMENLDAIFNRISRYGDWSVVIFNCSKFIANVKTTIEQLDYGLVTYRSQPSHTNPFEKSLEYKLDSEYRFVTSAFCENRIITIEPVSGFICKSKDLSTFLL